MHDYTYNNGLGVILEFQDLEKWTDFNSSKTLKKSLIFFIVVMKKEEIGARDRERGRRNLTKLETAVGIDRQENKTTIFTPGVFL